jgi:hypothetical protein
MTASGSPVIIFLQKGNKGVISFPYASVKFDPRRAVLDLADRNGQSTGAIHIFLLSI